VKLLLDTCTFLWLIGDAPELSAPARKLFTEPANEVFLSAASVWEIIVKHTLGKLPLPQPPHEFIPTWRSRHNIEPLPRDPFDRILVCQAIANGLTILTPDPLIRQYPVRVEW